MTAYDTYINPDRPTLDGGKEPNKYGVEFNPSSGDWNGTPGQYYADRQRPPAVPSNRGGSGGKGIRVNTEALKLFARNLRELRPLLDSCGTKLQGINLLPGHFEDAKVLTDKVLGKGSIKGATETFLTHAINSIVEYANGLDRLAAEYSKTEELNRATGANLQGFVKDALDDIEEAVGGATSLPSSSPTASPTSDPAPPTRSGTNPSTT